jgi:hypothetical protein
MVAQKEESKATSQIYWAGAFIAFGIPFLWLELLGLIYGVSPANTDLQSNMRLLIILFNLIGGFSGGYLVTMKSTVGWLQGGIVTGVMAYVLLEIVHAVLYGLGVVGDQFTMFALLLGSLIGAYSYEYTDLKNLINIGAKKNSDAEKTDDAEKSDEEKES